MYASLSASTRAKDPPMIAMTMLRMMRREIRVPTTKISQKMKMSSEFFVKLSATISKSPSASLYELIRQFPKPVKPE